MTDTLTGTLTDTLTDTLVLPQRGVVGMLEHARREMPNECVGLLLQGTGGVRRVSLVNVSATPEVAYEAAPDGLLMALQEADRRGERLVGLYHSHPQGPRGLSARDLSEARYTAPYLVVVPSCSVVSAYKIGDKGVTEVALVVTRDEG